MEEELGGHGDGDSSPPPRSHKKEPHNVTTHTYYVLFAARTNNHRTKQRRWSACMWPSQLPGLWWWRKIKNYDWKIAYNIPLCRHLSIYYEITIVCRPNHTTQCVATDVHHNHIIRMQPNTRQCLLCRMVQPQAKIFSLLHSALHGIQLDMIIMMLCTFAYTRIDQEKSLQFRTHNNPFSYSIFHTTIILSVLIS